MPEKTDQEERTESATPRRKEEARKKGQVAKSMDLTSAFMFLVSMVTIRFVFPSIFAEIMNIMKDTLSSLQTDIFVENSSGLATIRPLAFGAIMTIAKMLAPFALIVLAAALFINFAQVGFLISGESLTPKFDRINPAKGISRLISKRTVVSFIQSMFKIIVVGYVLYITIKGEKERILGLAGLPIKSAIAEISAVIFKMGIRSAILLFILAASDYAYQRWEYERSLRMTKQEVKEEMKQAEGDPLTKSRVRSIQREMAARRMMQEVPKADVIITNPVHLAVALKYDMNSDAAPKVCAKGARIVAERIKAIAREHNIPIVEDRPLARMLFKLELGTEIPVALYRAVAEILARILRKD
jgi:flagellar biosynthetic protein FlhB